MGLETYIYQMKKVDSSRIWTDEELYSKYEDEKPEVISIKQVEECPDFKIDGAEGYLFKCVILLYDPDKMMGKLGIKKEDGWEEYSQSSAPVCTPDEKIPEGEIECWFSFVNKHECQKDHEQWEYKELPIFWKNTEFTRPVEHWCILTVGEELAEMRKGANNKFYDDGIWDDNFCPVCSKKVLGEYMEKYFDDAPGYVYDNCRKVFKTRIYDKFKDGKGLCVLFD